MWICNDQLYIDSRYTYCFTDALLQNINSRTNVLLIVQNAVFSYFSHDHVLKVVTIYIYCITKHFVCECFGNTLKHKMTIALIKDPSGKHQLQLCAFVSCFIYNTVFIIHLRKHCPDLLVVRYFRSSTIYWLYRGNFFFLSMSQ